jgi:hypothetical protein
MNDAELHKTRRPSYGFRRVRGRYVVDPHERAIMSDLADSFLNGTSLDRLYFKLLRGGQRIRKGREWSRSRIHRAIQAELALRCMSAAELEALCPKLTPRPRRKVSRRVERKMVRLAGFIARQGSTDGVILRAVDNAAMSAGGDGKFAKTFWNTFDTIRPHGAGRAKMLQGLFALMRACAHGSGCQV